MPVDIVNGVLSANSKSLAFMFGNFPARSRRNVLVLKLALDAVK